MYVSTSQIILSLERLKDLHPFFGFAFFGFKKGRLPIGKEIYFPYSVIREEVLEPYYNPLKEFNGFFNPFKSLKRWVSPRYDTTSLQRIVADTFGEAFYHEKGSGTWGWREDYVEILWELMQRHQSSPISLLDIAVWLYRDDPSIPSEALAPSYLIEKALREFFIDDEEVKRLFYPIRERAVSLSSEAPDLNEVWNVVGWPDGMREEGGIFLEHLNLLDVGPAHNLAYFPRERLNVITGDNSLGKTFLLDCAWWAVTGNWPRHEAEPRRSKASGRAEISYGISGQSGRMINVEAPYSRLDESWQRPIDQHEGLGVYATHSGAFVLWDPIRPPNEPKSLTERTSHLVLDRNQVWDGLSLDDGARGRSIQIANGLIRDWASWQASGERYQDALKPFERCLRELSPPEGPVLRSGSLTRIASDSREFPSIRMPYGDVPIVYVSAGVQRVIALAYMLVWHWQQHLDRCRRAHRQPFKRMILMIDEVEAHLHPRWQRQILPAILRTVRNLSSDLSVQLHVSTHSPLVLASLEPDFRLSRDAIHHLTLDDDIVELEEIDTFKFGTVNSWLESDIFGLSSARSIEAEKAIESAKELQLQSRPSRKSIQEIHERLLKVLPDDDLFWVRWLHFAETHGVIGRSSRD